MRIAHLYDRYRGGIQACTLIAVIAFAMLAGLLIGPQYALEASFQSQSDDPSLTFAEARP